MVKVCGWVFSPSVAHRGTYAPSIVFRPPIKEAYLCYLLHVQQLNYQLIEMVFKKKAQYTTCTFLQGLGL